MGSSASVDSSTKANEVNPSDGGENKRKEDIMSKTGRLSIDDVQELCAWEEGQDPSKHLFFGQIFNTLKEWDHEVRNSLCLVQTSSCVATEPSVVCKLS